MGTNCQVYVLRNPAGRFYIGLSENVTTRVLQHNSGGFNLDTLQGSLERGLDQRALVSGPGPET